MSEMEEVKLMMRLSGGADKAKELDDFIQDAIKEVEMTKSIANWVTLLCMVPLAVWVVYKLIEKLVVG